MPVAGVTCNQDAERQAGADADREGVWPSNDPANLTPAQGAPACQLSRADKVIPDRWRLAPWLVPGEGGGDTVAARNAPASPLGTAK